MLRIIHTADVHLGARHDDLGEQAAAQRERQFAAFKAAIDLALSEKVDLFLIAGDLFDSNVQPRRSVERVAAELARLGRVQDPDGDHPGDPRRLRSRLDLPRVRPRGDGRQQPDRRDGHRPRPGPPVGPPGRPSMRSSTAGSSPPSERRIARWPTSRPTWPRRVPRRTRPTWHVGMVHGSIAIPGKTEHDEVVITTEEIAASGLDYLALGHWHSAQSGKAGAVSYAYSGAPEAVALDQDRAGKVLLVELDQQAGQADDHDQGSAGRADPVRKARGRCRHGRQPAGIDRSPGGARRTRISSSTSGWSACGATSSTSTSTRWRSPSRRPS